MWKVLGLIGIAVGGWLVLYGIIKVAVTDGIIRALEIDGRRLTRKEKRRLTKKGMRRRVKHKWVRELEKEVEKCEEVIKKKTVEVEVEKRLAEAIDKYEERQQRGKTSEDEERWAREQKELEERQDLAKLEELEGIKREGILD